MTVVIVSDQWSEIKSSGLASENAPIRLGLDMNPIGVHEHDEEDES